VPIKGFSRRPPAVRAWAGAAGATLFPEGKYCRFSAAHRDRGTAKYFRRVPRV